MPLKQPRPCAGDPSISNKELRFKEQQCQFSDREVEHHITAIQAIKNAEIENMLSRARLVYSCISKEQLQTPAMDFFKENCPNLMIVKNEKYPFYELQRKNKTDLLFNAGYTEVPASVRKLGIPSTDDLGFSARSVTTNLINAAALHLSGAVLADTFGAQIEQTPGVTGQRLSFGMTPKTQRQPKHGEMLLSAHGSPLGIYGDDEHLEAIKESEDDSHD